MEFKNKVINFFFVAILCFHVVVKPINYDNLIDYTKNNYGTVIGAGIFGTFVLHTLYNKKYQEKYQENKWTDAMQRAFPVNISNITLYPVVFSFGMTILGGSLLGFNYFSSGKFEFLNTHSKKIKEITKIFGAPLILNFITVVAIMLSGSDE